MPQDHYVAQTYLKAFADPNATQDPIKGGKLHAYSKRDLKHFTPFASGVCKTLNWDDNPKYLSPPDALGQWLNIFEPQWTGAVTRLAVNHHLSPADKAIIAGYWAYLSTCTPTWQRITADLQQSDTKEGVIGEFIEYAKTHPDEYPHAQEYLPHVEDGSLSVAVDKDYPKAVVTKQLNDHRWVLYNQEWHVVNNDTGELFLTSDNPSIFDFGTALHPARFLPLTPRLALWTDIDTTCVPPVISAAPPASKSFGRKATAQFVRTMNSLVIQGAENLVLSSLDRPYIAACVAKYKDWHISRDVDVRIPAEDGYYEVIQCRARPKRRPSV